MVELGEYESGSANAKLAAGRQYHACLDQVADPLTGGHDDLGLVRPDHHRLLDDEAGASPLRLKAIG